MGAAGRRTDTGLMCREEEVPHMISLLLRTFREEANLIESVTWGQVLGLSGTSLSNIS